MIAVLLNFHYSVMLVFLCLNHILWEADCVSKLNTPVVFHCLLAGHAAFLTLVQFLSLSLQLLGKGATNQRRCTESPALAPGVLTWGWDFCCCHKAWASATSVPEVLSDAHWCAFQFNNHLVYRINFVRLVNTLSLAEYMQFLEHH